MAVFAAPLAALAADWHQWRGPQRNGVAPESPALIDALPAAGLRPVWMNTRDIPAARGGGWSSPIVADGRVYLFTHKKQRMADRLPPKQFPYLPPEKRVGMTDEEYAEYERKRRDEDQARSQFFRYDEITYCLDAGTGESLWENRRESVYTRFAQSSSPAVIDGRLYVLGAGRRVRCLDAVTGKNVWETELPGTFRDEYLQSSLAVVDGVAIVLCGSLFGLDAGGGEILWQGDAESTRVVHTSPVVWRDGSQTLVIANVAGGDTMAFEPHRGRELWRVDSQAGHSTPVIAGDIMVTYGNSRKKGLRAFRISGEGAEPLWTFRGAADPGSSPVVVNGAVFVQGDRRLACVDLETGRAQWNTMLDVARPRYTSLLAADQLVIYAFDGIFGFAATADRFQPLMNGKIDETGLLADESTFRTLLNIDELEKTAEGQKEAERLWRKKFNQSGPLPCATPAIVDGRLYVRLKNGVACYDLRRESP